MPTTTPPAEVMPMVPEVPALARENYPPYHFVLCSHTADRIPEITQAVDDCDLVLVETVGMEADEVEYAFDLLNAITYGDFSPEEAAHQVESRIRPTDDLDDHFLLLLALQLYGSQKLIMPIDAMDGTFANRKQLIADTSLRHFFKRINRNRIQFDEALSDLSGTLSAWAEATQAREELVTDQLLEYPRHYPVGNFAKIGVVQGAGHTANSHDLARAGLNVSRQFVDHQTAWAAGAYQFNYRMQAIRNLRFKPERPLAPDLLGKVLMEAILQANVGIAEDEEREGSGLEQVLYELRTQVVDAATAHDRSNFFENWERIMCSRSKGRKQRVRALIADFISVYIPDVEYE